MQVAEEVVAYALLGRRSETVAKRLVRQQTSHLSAESRQIRRIGEQQAELDQVEADLRAQLERLTGGLAPDLKLPKIKL